LYRAHHEAAAALADYASALRIDPSLAVVHLARGRLLVEAGRPGDALPDLNRFLLIEPLHADGLMVRARALAAVGRGDAARDDYDRALQLADNPDWFIERARVVRATAGASAALAGLDQGIARLGPIVTLTLEAIGDELSLGRYDAALARLERFVSASGPHPRWLVERGEILRAAGRLDDARAAFTASLAAMDALPPPRQRTAQAQALRVRAVTALDALQFSASTK
jgi:tetratricopeptide (TPR) repeat protein